MNQAPPPVLRNPPPPVRTPTATPPPDVPGDDLDGPSFDGNTVMAASTSFGISMLAHLIVFSMLAFCIMRTEIESFIAIESDLAKNKPITDLETLKFDLAPLPTQKDAERTAKRTIVPITKSGPVGGVKIDIPAPEIGTRKPGQGAGGQGKLFGTGRDARSMVFVVDCSASMSGRRFSLAISELIRTINRLKSNQRFYVIFYSTETIPLFATPASDNIALPNGRARKRQLIPRKPARRSRRVARRLVPATASYKKRAEVWIKRLRASGGTRPAEAIQIALGMKPEVIYFLTDGAIPPETPQVIREANRHEVRINTVALGFAGSEELLKQIASQNNEGTYTFVAE